MCGPSSISSRRSRGCSSCGFAGSTANAARLIALLCVMTSVVSGCARWAESTAATSPATSAPLTPGAVVTDEWSYAYRGETFTESGEWVHLPAGEAGNLLLWIRSAGEAAQ